MLKFIPEVLNTSMYDEILKVLFDNPSKRFLKLPFATEMEQQNEKWKGECW